MDLSSAINVIESVAGFTDADTAVGEAWAVVLARLKPAPVPVAVSERPWDSADWCDTDGFCWISEVLESGQWEWQFSEPPGRKHSFGTHSLPANSQLLPAHALPLPSAEVEA